MAGLTLKLSPLRGGIKTWESCLQKFPITKKEKRPMFIKKIKFDGTKTIIITEDDNAKLNKETTLQAYDDRHEDFTKAMDCRVICSARKKPQLQLNFIDKFFMPVHNINVRLPRTRAALPPATGGPGRRFTFYSALPQAMD